MFPGGTNRRECLSGTHWSMVEKEGDAISEDGKTGEKEKEPAEMNSITARDFVYDR